MSYSLQASCGTSSSDDNFESFLQKVKITKQERYRISTGSLSDFISDSASPKKSLKKESINQRNSRLPQINCKDLGSRSTGKQFSKKLKLSSKQKLNKKSVVTPRREIIFSSDSDDDVFLTSALVNSNKKSSSVKSCIFTDSDQEAEISFKKPQVLRFSSSDSERDQVGSSSKTPSKAPLSNISINILQKDQYRTQSAAISGSDSDDVVPTLKSRILSLHPKKSSLHQDSFQTPVQSTLYKISSKQFHSEMVNRAHKGQPICSVRNCFLNSLDFHSKQKPGAFKTDKFDISARLFRLFNESVFDEQLPKDMPVLWCKRLTKTAGITKCKRSIKCYMGLSNESLRSERYDASIDLSEKVITNAYRLRDTLIHEMCHAAVWIINNVNESHGPFWKSWAAKAQRVHPELPRIERCHNYDVEYKYRYQCTRYVHQNDDYDMYSKPTRWHSG